MVNREDLKFITSFRPGVKSKEKLEELGVKLNITFCGQVDERGRKVVKEHTIKHMEEYLYGDLKAEVLQLKQMCLRTAGGCREMDDRFNKILEMLKIK